MRLTSFFVGVGTLLLAIVVLAWATSPDRSKPVVNSRPAVGDGEVRPDAEGRYARNPFKPAGEPRPKAVVPEVEFNFGRMGIGEIDSHLFTIKNEGEGPLKLALGHSSCVCTVHSLVGNEVAPGDSVEVELKWHPAVESAAFEQSAAVFTNDPQKPVIEFLIAGEVAPFVMALPGGVWDVGMIAEQGPTVFKALLLSMLKPSFEIESIEAGGETVAVTSRPLTAEELAPLRALSGYELACEIRPVMPIGRFSENVVVKTNIAESPQMTYLVAGTRAGPFHIVGPGWFQQVQQLRMGRFPARNGKTVNLSLFVTGAADEQAITGVDVAPPVLHVEVERDLADDVGGRQLYRLRVIAPPGIEPARYWDDSAVKVVLHCRHPEVDSAGFQVELQAD